MTQKEAKHAYPKERKTASNVHSVYQKHLAAVARKNEKLGMLKAILETGLAMKTLKPHEEIDLTRRIRTQQVQLTAMRP